MKTPRREHDYGEERRGHFGIWVADCVRPGCEAFRVKNRDRTRTTFKQTPFATGTSDPGPCEVEP